MPRTRRLLPAGLAVAGVLEGLALASSLALQAPGITWWLALTGGLVASVAVIAVRLIERPFPGPDDDAPRDDPADDPPPPPWWPGFERDFRAYAARSHEGV